MAGVQECAGAGAHPGFRAFARAFLFFLRQNGHDGLEGRCRQGAEKFRQVGAAVYTAQPLFQRAGPAGSDPEADDLLVGRHNPRTDLRERRKIRDRFNRPDLEIVREGEADPHVVHGGSRTDGTAFFRGEIIGFGIGDMAFNIPKSVRAAIPLADDATCVQRGAFRQGR